MPLSGSHFLIFLLREATHATPCLSEAMEVVGSLDSFEWSGGLEGQLFVKTSAML